jgi:hypothetical protein
MTLRRLHYRMAIVLIAPLALTAATGLAYRVGRNWFGMSDETGAFVRGLHEGAFLGEAAAPFYVLFVGLGLLAMIGTGLTLWRGGPSIQWQAGGARWLHRWIAAVLALPLAVSATTGIAFRLTQAWFGWSKSEAKFLLDIHQGTYLGPTWRAYYVIFIGLGLLMVLVTGLQLFGWRWKRPPTRP